ncbi:hypothetical protein ACOMHN_008459 [Nucella lapillus]
MFQALVPVFIMLLENQEVQRLSDGYDVGRGFVMGEEEIRSRIDHMADRKDIIEELRTHCDCSKMDILKELGLLQKDNPEVAMGVKTRQAIRSVLNNVRDEIHMLLQDGVLEEAEGCDLAGMVESKMKKLLTAPPKVPLPSTEKILHNVPWISDNEDLVRFIQTHAKLSSYEYGDIIMKQSDLTTGVSIILSGLVKLELSIPVTMDSPDGEPKYITRVLDFQTAGNVLGELGVLTGKPRSATVKCETGVQLLEISFDDIQEAFIKFQHMDPPLKYRLWRLSAIRLCTGIFLDQPSFLCMTKEKLRVRLENGYVEEIQDTPSTFPISFHIGEVVLLHGEAVDGYTLDRFSGPCYIPQQVQMLCFETHQSPNPALFILPTENCPAICRPSVSVQEGGQIKEERSSTHPMQYLSTPALPGGRTVSSAGLSGSNVAPLGMYKRTALHQIREMNEKKDSIQLAIRRGSTFQSKMFKKAKGTRSISIHQGSSMMAGMSPSQENKTAQSLIDPLREHHRLHHHGHHHNDYQDSHDHYGTKDSSEKDQSIPSQTASDPNLAVAEMQGNSSRRVSASSRSLSTHRGPPRVPFSMMTPSPYPIHTPQHQYEFEPTENRFHLRSGTSLSSFSSFSVTLDSLKHHSRVNPLDFYTDYHHRHHHGRKPGDIHEIHSTVSNENMAAATSAPDERPNSSLEVKNRKGKHHSMKRKHKQDKNTRKSTDASSSSNPEQMQKEAPDVNVSEPQTSHHQSWSGSGSGHQNTGAKGSQNRNPTEDDHHYMLAEGLNSYFPKKLSMIAERRSFDSSLSDAVPKSLSPNKNVSVSAEGLKPKTSQQAHYVISIPQKPSVPPESLPPSAAPDPKGSASKGQEEIVRNEKVEMSALEPKVPGTLLVDRPVTSGVDSAAVKAVDATGHTSGAGPQRDGKSDQREQEPRDVPPTDHSRNAQDPHPHPQPQKPDAPIQQEQSVKPPEPLKATDTPQGQTQHTPVPQTSKDKARVPQAKEPQAKEPQAREPPAKESQAREHQAKEPQAKEPQAREAPAKESQAREPQARVPQAKEPQAKEPQAREPPAKESQAREPQAREPPVKEPHAREPQAREPQSREPPAKEPQSREPRAKEPQAREPQAKEPPAREPQAKEPQAREPQAREPQAREPQAREPQAREPQAREPPAKESQAREPQAREPQAREPQAREPQAREPPAKEPQARQPQTREPQARKLQQQQQPVMGAPDSAPQRAPVLKKDFQIHINLDETDASTSVDKTGRAKETGADKPKKTRPKSSAPRSVGVTQTSLEEERLLATAGPSQKPIDPSHKPTDPSPQNPRRKSSASQSIGVTQTNLKEELKSTVGPSQKPSDPSHKPTDPYQDPSHKPTDPSHKPTNPSHKPTDPSHKPTEPSHKPTDPSQKQ